MTAAVIRPATDADRQALGAIDRVAWSTASTPAPLPLSGDWAGEVLLDHLLVADRDGEVVGYVLIGPRHGDLTSSAHLGLVRGMAVHPDARGQGTGRKLLTAAIDHASALGFEALVLNVMESNPAALALYRSVGFQVAGFVPDHFELEGKRVGDYLLHRSLLPDAAEPEAVDGGCHCGAVRFRVTVRRWEVLACNCSMCTKKALLHLIVDDADLRVLQGADALATYTFGTGVAQHHFCRTCGIHPFYKPRSHPEGWSVNARCLDGDAPDRFVVRPFDGRNWEANVESIR